MSPILFDLGFIQLRYYGLMYALALIAMLVFAKRDLAQTSYKLSPENLENIMILSFVGGVLGGRIYYVLFNTSYYFSSQTPWYEPFAIWHGGLAIHGGLLGGIIFAKLACRRHNVSLFAMTDLAAPYILLGQAFGRFGNFMNGDAHGVPTDLPWGIVFRYGPATTEFPNLATHPVMLYELILNLFGFVFLFFLRKKKFRAGFLSACYFIIYGIVRAIVTNFRADDLYFASIRAPHLFALISVIVAGALIYQNKLYTRDNLIFIK